MKVMKTFTIEASIIEAFDKRVNRGERSKVMEEIIKDYLERFFPEKEGKGLSRELDIRNKKAELEELLEQERLIDERRQRELLEVERVRGLRVEESARQSFEDDCRSKAKQLTNVEFGFEPLLGLLPDNMKSDVRGKYMLRWKELTRELIEKGGE